MGAGGPGSRHSALLQLLQPVQLGADPEFRSGGDARDTGASHITYESSRVFLRRSLVLSERD